jgi:hypothetical protein
MSTPDELRERAHDALATLAGLATAADVDRAKPLVEALRNIRDYELMGRLAEAVSRRDPKDARNRRLYAQCLIESGMATAAVDLLRPLQRLGGNDPESREAAGLLGRAYKQIFMEAGDKTDPAVRDALKSAIGAYRRPFEADAANTWHGVNLLALLTRARRLGLRVAPDLSPQEVAARVIDALDRQPAEARDAWYLATLAEASLGLGDWPKVEACIRGFAAGPHADAFQIASTLRQFTGIWDLEEADPRGRGLVTILRARLAELPGGTLELRPGQLQQLRSEPPPMAGQLEAVLGADGPQTYRWWKTGLDRAVAVGAIRERLGGRIGTGFLVRAGDLGLEPPTELLVLTNNHVVSEDGAAPGIRARDAEMVFEAVDPNRAYAVEQVLWSSPVARLDASLLRLAGAVSGIEPLPISVDLPAASETARVYLLGYPGGRELAFSFQDNQLLDHEGPPAGVPQIPGVCRVHYRAPTEGGSSGSPVFNARSWQVIALHHRGGKLGMARLNGQPGTYAANEGIAMASIVAATKTMPPATGSGG